MDGITRAVILGIVQGITEWLPVSSSGHLVIFQNLIGINESDLFFDIMLHFGSLLVIFLVFRKDLIDLAKGIIRKDKASIKLFTYLIIGSVPIAFVGFFLNSLIKSIFNSLTTVGISLIITSILLFISGFRFRKKHSIGLKNSFIIGIAQALAILPGVSRSGTTISTAMILGIEKEEAARFSFLLVIPAILGATLLELKDIVMVPDIMPLLVGTAVSVITGFLSLKLLLLIIKKNQLHLFSWYCAALGILILIFS